MTRMMSPVLKQNSDVTADLNIVVQYQYNNSPSDTDNTIHI